MTTMLRMVSAAWCGVLLSACATVGGGVSGALAEPNLLVIGEDGDRDTVERGHRAFNRVLRAMQSELNQAGFNVYDETAVTLRTLVQERTNRDNAEIVEVCRAARTPPLDVAVIFSIWPRSRSSEIATYLSVRVEGRMLECRSGRIIGFFEQSLSDLPDADLILPVACDRDCILEEFGGVAAGLGRDVAHVLALQLAHLVPGSGNQVGDPDPVFANEFTLVFDGFDGRQADRVEDFLVAFDGYVSHRPVRTTPTSREYRYRTASDVAQMQGNFDRMLDHLGVEAIVRFSGITFRVESVGLRRRVN